MSKYVTPITEKPGWVRVTCAGGCGRHVELRAKKLEKVDFYVCNSRESGRQCEAALPSRFPGQLRVHVFNAAAHFSGVSYRWPSPEQAVSVARAQNILAAGLTQIAIAKAKS